MGTRRTGRRTTPIKQRQAARQGRQGQGGEARHAPHPPGQRRQRCARQPHPPLRQRGRGWAGGSTTSAAGRPEAPRLAEGGEAPRPPHALCRPVVCGPNDRRDREGPEERLQDPWRRAARSPIDTAALDYSRWPSRAFRLVFRGAPGALADPRANLGPVPAASTIRRRAPAIGRPRPLLRPSLVVAALRVPRGLVVVLQGREGGKWSTF